jgi:hypothetical protein
MAKIWATNSSRKGTFSMELNDNFQSQLKHLQDIRLFDGYAPKELSLFLLRNNHFLKVIK